MPSNSEWEAQFIDAFEVKTGVKQGCLLSPMIFLVVVDWIMQQTMRSCEKRGIRWTAEKNLEDLDFAGDLCLMSHKLEDVQGKTKKLTEEARQGSEDGTSSEYREDRGDEDTKSTTNSSHHQREKLKENSLLHLPVQHCFNYRRDGRGR
ncbi:unnamed protein product [Heterobilharzia americana]|nr:unnamed protein product [Heterobilharzia americana]